MKIDFNADYVLENDRVILRPLNKDDKRNLLKFSVDEPELWQFSLQSAAGEDNLDNYLQIALEARKDQKEYPFIVFDKRTSSHAGSTRFYDIQVAYETLQLGYTWYGKEFQGTGLNKNCKYLLFQFAFEQIGAERLELRADNDNARSIAAMKSIGCKVDGILRANMPKPAGVPGRRDSIVLSVLRKEWLDDVKYKLKEQIDKYNN